MDAEEEEEVLWRRSTADLLIRPIKEGVIEATTIRRPIMRLKTK